MTPITPLSRAIDKLDRAEQAARQARADALKAAADYAAKSGHFGFTLDAARRTLAFERGRRAA